MTSCKEHGCHDFILLGVEGTLPYQALDVKCSRCGLREYFENHMVSDDNE